MSQALSHTVFSIKEFEPNSYITQEGKRREDLEFFIILEGYAEVQKLSTEKNNYCKELHKGDFFGVISGMTGLPELESIVTKTPLKLIAIHRDKFENLIQKTPALAVKIIRSYSLVLRNLDTLQIKTLGGNLIDYSKENSLFELANSYLKQGNKTLASYMFQKYLALHPKGEYANQAKTKLPLLPKLEKTPCIQENIRHCYPGEIIFCEAEPGNSLYVILEGEVKILRNLGHSEITVNILSSGEIFGEMALLDKKPRSATAIANTNVKLAVVNQLNFESTTELKPNLMKKIITALSERVWLLQKKVENHYIEDINKKIADALFIYYEQFKQKSDLKFVFEYPFSPEEFLKSIGLGFDKMEALLRFTSSHNFINIEEGKIFCLNPEALGRYVQTQIKNQT